MEMNGTDRTNISNPFMEKHYDRKLHPLSISSQKPQLLISKRFLITVLLLFVNICMIFNSFNINAATIEMTAVKRIVVNGNVTLIQPEFQWDSKIIGLVFSANFYGELLSFMGGPIIPKLGGSTGMSLSMMLSSIITILQPISLNYNFYLFLFGRFLIGMCQGICAASTNEICSYWMPKTERATLISLTMNGIYVGLAIVHSLCGFLAFRWGWPMVFYITGAMCLTLSISCLILIRNHPSEDRCISKKELSFILKQTDTARAKKDITSSYRNIITSKPIWVILMACFVSRWVIIALQSSLLLFVKDLTGKDTQDVAFISSLPSMTGIFLSPFAGLLLDYWKNTTNINLTMMHKIVIGTAFASQFVLFIFLTFIRDLITIIIIFILIRLFIPFIALILRLMTINIAPNHSGIVTSFTTVSYSLTSIAAQMSTGFMTINHTLEEWNRCFFLTAGLQLFGCIMFTLFGSSEPQPWSLSSNLKKPINSTNKEESDSALIEK